MAERVRVRSALDIRRTVLVLLLFAIVPSLLLSSVGILTLVNRRAAVDVVFGVLILTFAGSVLAGGILASALMRRSENLARLQSDFVSNVSHELRTPLTSIRMFVETLRMGRAKDQSEIQRCLEILATETARLTTLIEQVLDFTRMESGRRTYARTPTSARAIVEEARKGFAALALQTEVDLRVEWQEDVALLGDRVALAQAVLCLLENALKYTGEEKRVRLVGEARGGEVALWVEDNGPGIPKRLHRKVFQRFYRGDELGRTAGTGLGLAMVSHIVDAHGGKVQLDSEPGAGARFTILLPKLESA
ncbi:MAG: sensor histidine kinase [Deltaproteobacteria bacterium]|nr:sensor histidine kinase [Deltaproteobacteria bacterium]